jgi:oligopeptide transport system substrate-binding protein
MTRRLFGLPFFAALAASLFFCGCNCRSSSKQKSKDLHLYLRIEPWSLDPRVGGDSTSQFILRDLFEGLTRYGKDGPELALADSVSISEDKSCYTFHLRPSIWSNGQEVTTADFEYAWKSVISSALASKFVYAFFIIKNAQKANRGECSIDEVGIESLDVRTLRVTLEHPAPYFLQWTSNPIYSPVCRAAVEKENEWSKASFPWYVCNGPFILKEHVVNSYLVLEKNKSYWDQQAVQSNRIEFPVIEDGMTAYNLFCAGKLDWYGAPCAHSMPPELVTQLLNNKSFHYVLTRGAIQLDCCVKKPYLASPKIRKALAQAINRKELSHHLYSDTDTPATSVVPQWLSLLPCPTFEDGNPQASRQLFEEGLLELGYTRDSYPELTLFADIRFAAMAEVISNQLQEALGISIAVKISEIKTMLQKLTSNEHDLALLGWISWLQDPIYNLDVYKFRDNRMTFTWWQNDQYIKLLDASDATTDDQERQQLLAEAETLLMTELPTIPLLYNVDKYVRSSDVSGDCYSYFDVPELKGLEKRISSPPGQ